MSATPFVRALVALALCSASLAAQNGSISGRVTDSSAATGLGGARVEARSGGATAAQTTSADDGSYRLADLAAGPYLIVVSHLGYAQKRLAGVRVTGSEATTLNVPLVTVTTQLNPVVTTASRAPEKILDAPASVAIVEAREIEARPSITAADHLKSVPGLSVSAGGIAQSNIVARGFNNAFSGQLLTLQDYRFAGVPSLRVNVPLLFTGSNEDIERMEVLLGPASALYGPNSGNGVLHIITKSPFDSKGTILTLDGGERSILRAGFRTAATAGEKVGLKLSGEYFTGKDFQYRDPGEPAVFPAQAPADRRGDPITRDFDVNRIAGEARVDLRPKAGTEFITTYGFSRIGNGLEITGANGAAQAKNWMYQSLQERFRWNRLFVQAFVNVSDAGNKDSLDTRGTYLLRSGQPIVDKSRVYAFQVQHAHDFGVKQGFVYGLDYIKTNPRSGGTINGRNEDIDDVQEIGGYVQSTTHLTPKIDFLGALRLDQNDQVEGSQFSPRAAIAFKPTPNQNFRLTYNRAFATAANFSYFLDLINTRNLGGTGFDVRAMGNPPKEGWHYAKTCDATVFGGFCMKGPFTGTGFVSASSANSFPALVAANGTLLRSALVPGITALLVSQGVPQAQAEAQATGLAGGLVTFLGGLRPTPTDIASKVRYITPGSRELAPTDLRDIGPLGASYNNTYEAGYKGILGQRARLALDFWFQQRGDVGTPASLVTPNVFLDSLSLRSYLTPRIAGALQQSGLSPAAAAAAAAQIAAGFTSKTFNPANKEYNLAFVPLGVVTFANPLANPNDIIATYQSVKKTVNVSGIDVAVDFLATDRVTLSASYDYVSKSLFPDVQAADGSILALNAPNHRIVLATKWRDEAKGLSFELRGRYANTFNVESGVFSSLRSFNDPTDPTKRYTYPKVPVNALLDFGFSWRLPLKSLQQVTWSLNGTNLFNNDVATFDGVPDIGRLVMTRLQYAF